MGIADSRGRKLDHGLEGVAVHADVAVAPFLGGCPVQDFVDLRGARLEGGIHDSERCPGPGPFDHEDGVAMLDQVLEIFGAEEGVHQVPPVGKPIPDPEQGPFFPAKGEQIGDDVLSVLIEDGEGAQVRGVFEKNRQWPAGWNPTFCGEDKIIGQPGSI